MKMTEGAKSVTDPEGKGRRVKGGVGDSCGNKFPPDYGGDRSGTTDGSSCSSVQCRLTGKDLLTDIILC